VRRASGLVGRTTSESTGRECSFSTRGARTRVVLVHSFSTGEGRRSRAGRACCSSMRREV
jgi:hypothetical protein